MAGTTLTPGAPAIAINGDSRVSEDGFAARAGVAFPLEQ